MGCRSRESRGDRAQALWGWQGAAAGPERNPKEIRKHRQASLMFLKILVWRIQKDGISNCLPKNILDGLGGTRDRSKFRSSYAVGPKETH